MPNNNVPVIKKVKKITAHGAHGGSWKVAYADFVTAMMAFFLLLWLINSIKPEQKEQISTYFQEFNLLDSEAVLDSMKKKVSAKPAEQKAMEEIKDQIEQKLGGILDQIMVEIFPGGVKIQIIDKEGNPIFNSGSVEPTAEAIRILKVLASNIRILDAKIAIEGHTDAHSFPSQLYTNWELSTGRASAARIILENEGINTKNLIRVSGFADTQPLDESDPFSQLNRRIGILLYFEKKDSQQKTEEFLNQVSTHTP